MNLAKPYASLSTTLDLELLVELARSTTPRSGRELARRIERSWGGVGPVLERLVEHGLVKREEVGATYIFRLNREHLLASLIEHLSGLRTTFFSRIRELIADWESQPLHASIFGSMARGDGDAKSDIDFFVVRPRDTDLEDPTWRHQLDDLTERVRTWSGNAASVIEVGADELADLRHQRRAVLDEIRSDAIDLAGETVRQVMGK